MNEGDLSVEEMYTWTDGGQELILNKWYVMRSGKHAIALRVVRDATAGAESRSAMIDWRYLSDGIIDFARIPQPDYLVMGQERVWESMEKSAGSSVVLMGPFQFEWSVGSRSSVADEHDPFGEEYDWIYPPNSPCGVVELNVTPYDSLGEVTWDGESVVRHFVPRLSQGPAY